jgi:hypothetical protein
MREEVLRRYFLGRASAAELADDLSGSSVERRDVTYHPIEDMDDDFEVRPEHLARLCDAVLGGELEAGRLEAVGFCIVASDHFCYDAETPEADLVGEVAALWATPRANYPLTTENVRKFREWLVTGSRPFGAGDASAETRRAT